MPQQQQPAPELPQTTLGPSPFSFFGKVQKLKGPNADYRISARSGKSIFTLPCSVSGKKCRHRNRDWHRIVPSSVDSAVVQSSALGSKLECCYGQRFQVNSKSGPKVVVTPLKWPLTNKTVPTPNVELLLCCHTCYQGTLFSQAPAAPYPVVDPVVQSPTPMEQQLAALLRIEQTRADACEADALQGRLYRERIRKNDPGYKGLPEDYPSRKTEVGRRQSDQAKHW